MPIAFNIKIDTKEVDQLQVKLNNTLRNHPEVRNAAKAVAIQFLTVMKSRYIALAKGDLPKTIGDKPWQRLSWVGFLLRKKKGAKVETLDELNTNAAKKEVLRDTGVLFNSLTVGDASNVLRVNNGLFVETGTRHKDAEKHHRGEGSKWPGEKELLEGLDRHVKKIAAKSTVTAGSKRKATRNLSLKRARSSKRTLTERKKATKVSITQLRSRTGGSRAQKSRSFFNFKKAERDLAKQQKSGSIKNLTGRIKKLKDTKVQKKNWNPDYFKILRSIKGLAGKSFRLAIREILTPNISERQRKSLARIWAKGIKEAVKDL